jgi:hypothetical protein
MQWGGRYHALAKERTMVLRCESLEPPISQLVKLGPGALSAQCPEGVEAKGSVANDPNKNQWDSVLAPHQAIVVLQLFVPETVNAVQPARSRPAASKLRGSSHRDPCARAQRSERCIFEIPPLANDGV